MTTSQLINGISFFTCNFNEDIDIKILVDGKEIEIKAIAKNDDEDKIELWTDYAGVKKD